MQTYLRISLNAIHRQTIMYAVTFWEIVKAYYFSPKKIFFLYF